MKKLFLFTFMIHSVSVFAQEEGRTPLAYQIVMRNASGKILPMRLNIRTNK